jgi:hypothetical protein
MSLFLLVRDDSISCVRPLNGVGEWMMNQIDDAIRRLAETPVPSGLASIEAAVLEEVAGHRFGRSKGSGALGVVLAAGALVMGIGAGTLPSGEAKARSAVGPFGGAPELAPSTLLVGK